MTALRLCIVAAALAGLSVPSAVCSPKPKAGDIEAAVKWNKSHLQASATSRLPFSFVIGGKSSRELMANWRIVRSSKRLDDKRLQRTSVWTDPRTKLQVRCVAVEYSDYPTVEWTVYIKNTGNTNSPIVSDIMALDVSLNRGTGGSPILHHTRGTPNSPADYQPLMTALPRDVTKRISARGGRPSDSDLPYFNLEWPGSGVIVAVGWPGQWAAEFAGLDNNAVSIKAGQELTHFTLHPREEVRTPLMVLQFYSGGWIDAQNAWRRWMVDHNLPRPGGKLPPIQMEACSSHQFHEMFNANTENQLLFISRYLEERLPLDYWWMDIGWYPGAGWLNESLHPVDQSRFPGGLRPIADYAHSKGVKILVWFEPERIEKWMTMYGHPTWVLYSPDEPVEQKVYNLGHPEALRFLISRTDTIIASEGIDLYRQDINIEPLSFWRHNDTPNRQGITENHYVQGYLTYWDALRQRYPNMLIDSCAGGGRRNDLETLRRAVPLLRSDRILEPVGQQCHTYGIAFWYPYYGTGAKSADTYEFRSIMCPSINACYDMRDKDLDYESMRRLFRQWKEEIAPNYYGDYYPLTDYSLAHDVWMAYQWNRPEAGKGVVVAFRREKATGEAVTLKLHGLDPQATYSLRDLDTDSQTTMTGKALMSEGLKVGISSTPGSAVVIYSKSGQAEAAAVGSSPLLDRLKSSPSRVEDTQGEVVSPSRVRVKLEWSGNLCRPSVTNTSSEPARLGNIILFDLAPHGMGPNTPIYGESFQMLNQTTGTIGKPIDLFCLTDRAHYRIPEPDGMRTTYGVMTFGDGPSGYTLLGFTSCRKFIGRFSFDNTRLRVSVDPERLELAPGETWKLEEFLAVSGNDRNALLRQLASAIEANHPRLPLAEIPTGWCSWYCYGDTSDRTIIRDNMTRFARILPELKYIQIDDGYSPYEGDWLNHSDAFGDIRSLMGDITGLGFVPALWVAPFIAERNSRVLKEHPDWFVKDADGKPLDSGTVGFGGWRHGPWFVLDGTNPEVQRYFEHMFRTMRQEWGVRYFKLDANYWGAIHGGKHHDPKATRVEAYRRGMEAVLRGASRDAVVLGCNAPIWPSLGVVNSMRVTRDVDRSWEAFRDLAFEAFNRNWQNGHLWVNDPDCVVLADADLPESVWMLHATVVHASGGLVLSGDKAESLTQERLSILRRLLSPTGRGAEFEDERFEVGTMDMGDRHYYYCFNWSDTPADRLIKLPGECHLKDYWSDADMGTHTGSYTLRNLPGRSARLMVATMVKPQPLCSNGFSTHTDWVGLRSPG